MDIWNILGIIAIICLIASFSIGKNVIWAALTISVIIGLVISIFRGFEWVFLKKVVIVGTLTGALFELIYKLFHKQIYLYKQKRIIEKRIREEVMQEFNKRK